MLIPLDSNLMADLTYGSVEYYTQGFSDFFADVDAENPATVDNLIDGFYRALDSWFTYHDEQARAYADIRKRVRQALTV